MEITTHQVGHQASHIRYTNPNSSRAIPEQGISGDKKDPAVTQKLTDALLKREKRSPLVVQENGGHRNGGTTIHHRGNEYKIISAGSRLHKNSDNSETKYNSKDNVIEHYHSGKLHVKLYLDDEPVIEVYDEKGVPEKKRPLASYSLSPKTKENLQKMILDIREAAIRDNDIATANKLALAAEALG